MSGLVYYLALVVGLFAVALLGAAATGALVGESALAGQFLVMAGLAGFVAGAVFFALRGRERTLGRVGGYLLAIALWVVPAIGAAVPIMIAAETTYISALFEAVSGYTTTGATVFMQLDDLPRALIFWRAELQWLGGLVTLIMLVTILGPAGLGGLPSGRLGVIETVAARSATHSLSAVRSIAVAYGFMTTMCILLLMLVGLPPFDAFCLAFSAVSTGGFMVRDGDLAIYHNGYADFILAVFMLLGATGILWQRMLLRAHWQLLAEHRESYWVIGVALAVGLAYAVEFQAIGQLDLLGSLRDGMLTGVSLVTTTGFIPREHAFSALGLPLALILALAGGAAFSTAGGLKYFRIGGMFVQAIEELRRLVHPHGVRASRFGSQRYEMPLMKAIWSHFVASILVVVIASLFFAIENIDYEGALLVAVASFANIGGLYDSAWAEAGVEWPTYAAFADANKLIAAATMILGRIEVIALMGAVSVVYWKS